jgi:hypothetical protein
MAKAKDDDGSLKRLGGGRWQTRDERFTIEPQSGTWVVVDADQTDDLGLPLIRGPFGSLGAAKDAIAAARTSGKPVKPLPTPARAVAPSEKAADAPSRSGTDPAPTKEASSDAKPAKTSKASEPSKVPKASKSDAPAEPRWLAELAPADRRRARDAVKRLTDAGAPDPEGMTRRDVSGGVPSIAAYAIRRRIDDLGPDATPQAIVGALADGRDDDLAVRWRIVDGAGRPILIAPSRSAPRRR